MNKAQYQRVSTLFTQARKLEVRTRADFLVEAEADPNIRREVERLLEELEKEGECFELERAFEADLANAVGEILAAPTGTEMPERIGRYRILSKIGEGAMGTVFEAEQDSPKRIVAVKVIRPGHVSKETLRRFAFEAESIARLNHPGVAQIYDAGTAKLERKGGESIDVPFFAMERVPGQRLGDFLAARNLEPRSIVALVIEICEAVHHAHQCGIVHRDLKPANVLVTDDAPGRFQTKVLDFGVARSIEDRSASSRTRTGQVIGTLAYMSPEQVEGRADQDIRIDVYALGVILYEALTGELPIDVTGDALVEAAKRIQNETPRSLDQVKPGIDRDLATIVQKAMEKEAQRRYSSAAEMALDLGRYLSNEPILARAPTAPYLLRKFAARNRVLVTSVTLVVISLILGTTFALVGLFRAEKDAARAEKATAELLGLADWKRVEDANQAARLLFPLAPEQLPKMKRWLEERAQRLIDNLPKHEEALARLRTQASEWTAEERERDRETHPRTPVLIEALAEIKEMQKWMEEDDSSESFDEAQKSQRLEESLEYLDELAAEVAEHEAAIGVRRTFTFLREDGSSNDELQWQHDTRAALLERLKEFSEGEVSGHGVQGVQWRIAEIERVENESLRSSEAMRRWADCIADLATDDEVYDGLSLEPQFGLLPLGRNERTGFWEFVHLLSGTEPIPNPDWQPADDEQTERSRFNRWQIEEPTGIVLVLVPAMRAWMGAVHPSLDVEFESESMTVLDVQESSFGFLMGLRAGDELITLQSVELEEPEPALYTLRDLTAGDEVKAEVLREGERIELAATLPAGCYDPDAQENEGPSVQVDLAPYFIGKYETTQAQWMRLVGDNPSRYQPGFTWADVASLIWPVESISWHDARQGLTRAGLELPTEAQWEAAARAGTQTPYWSGREAISLEIKDAANITDKFAKHNRGAPTWSYDEWRDDGYCLASPVGAMRANSFGLHDTMGNLEEWCLDEYVGYKVLPVDLTGLRKRPGHGSRSVRGGVYSRPAIYARSSSRVDRDVDRRTSLVGCRAARRVE